MSITETFSNSIDLGVINESDKGDLMQIWTVLGHVYHLLVKRFSKTGLFRYLSNGNFRVCNFGNTKALRVIFFSKSSKFDIYFKNSVKN